MANTIMQKLKRIEIERKTSSTQQDSLTVPITTELYPNEIVDAAQVVLGNTVLKDYHCELYSFAYDAQQQNLPILAAQMSGVLLTHKKIVKWLKDNNVIDVMDLANPAVMEAFVRYHMKNKAESDAVLDIILNSIMTGQ